MRLSKEQQLGKKASVRTQSKLEDTQISFSQREKPHRTPGVFMRDSEKATP